MRRTDHLVTTTEPHLFRKHSRFFHENSSLYTLKSQCKFSSASNKQKQQHTTHETGGGVFNDADARRHTGTLQKPASIAARYFGECATVP
jgi:hypothetical protein